MIIRISQNEVSHVIEDDKEKAIERAQKNIDQLNDSRVEIQTENNHQMLGAEKKQLLKFVYSPQSEKLADAIGRIARQIKEKKKPPQ